MPRPRHHAIGMDGMDAKPQAVKAPSKHIWFSFVLTLLQLSCSMAIIFIVRYNLGGYWNETCLAATEEYPWTCSYACSLAAVSICCGFWLSFMQCITLDCCGLGRAVEAMLDLVAVFWWMAGGITLGVRASDANSAGVAEAAARNAVVALCWVSAALFLALLINNLVLIKRLGKAYKAAQAVQMQPITTLGQAGVPYVVTTVPQPFDYMPQPAVAPNAGWAAGPPVQPSMGPVPPAGYPVQVPQAAAAYPPHNPAGAAQYPPPAVYPPQAASTYAPGPATPAATPQAAASAPAPVPAPAGADGGSIPPAEPVTGANAV